MGTCSLGDAHVWWAYVYHEMKRQRCEQAANSACSLTAGIWSASPTTSEFVGDSEASLVLNKLRDSLRKSAIEISTLRQVSRGIVIVLCFIVRC